MWSMHSFIFFGFEMAPLPCRSIEPPRVIRGTGGSLRLTVAVQLVHVHRLARIHRKASEDAVSH